MQRIVKFVTKYDARLNFFSNWLQLIGMATQTVKIKPRRHIINYALFSWVGASPEKQLDLQMWIPAHCLPDMKT